MRTVIAFLLFAMCVLAPAQDAKRLYRIRIQHADPQLVYMLLRGWTTPYTPPELSTLSFRGGNGGFGDSGFGGGKPGMGG